MITIVGGGGKVVTDRYEWLAFVAFCVHVPYVAACHCFVQGYGDGVLDAG